VRKPFNHGVWKPPQQLSTASGDCIRHLNEGSAQSVAPQIRYRERKTGDKSLWTSKLICWEIWVPAQAPIPHQLQSIISHSLVLCTPIIDPHRLTSSSPSHPRRRLPSFFSTFSTFNSDLFPSSIYRITFLFSTTARTFTLSIALGPPRFTNRLIFQNVIIAVPRDTSSSGVSEMLRPLRRNFLEHLLSPSRSPDWNRPN
jgi:hypothetical protein